MRNTNPDRRPSGTYQSSKGQRRTDLRACSGVSDNAEKVSAPELTYEQWTRPKSEDAPTQDAAGVCLLQTDLNCTLHVRSSGHRLLGPPLPELAEPLEVRPQLTNGLKRSA